MYRLRRYFPDSANDPSRPPVILVSPMMMSANVFDVLTIGVDAVWTFIAGAAFHNLRSLIFESQAQPPSTQDLELGGRFYQGPLCVPDLLCTAADQAHRAFASRGLSGVSAARDGRTGRCGWSWRVTIAASTVLAAGSKPSGSPIRNTRETASPGTTAQPVPARAQQTETLCSAEKPSVPKKSRPRRSRISARQRVSCPTVYWVRRSALDASMSPWALMTVTDDLSRRVPSCAVWPSQGRERKPTSGSTEGAGGAFMVIPTCGCHRFVRRELLLCEDSGGRLTPYRTG